MEDLEYIGERKNVKNVFEELNLGLLIHVINRSLLYGLVFIIITATIAYAYLRWTPNVYESSAVLMIKQAKQTQLLGIQDLLKSDMGEIKQEIGLMKSSFIIDRAIDSLDLGIQYFTKGRLIETENYKTNPYTVKFNVLNPILESNKINIHFLNKNEFEYRYRIKDDIIIEKGFVNKQITNKDFSLLLTLKKGVSLKSIEKNNFFFLKRTKQSLINEIKSNIQIFPTLSGSKTIKLLYKDTNPLKAKDIVESISNAFISYDREKKAESINNILSFLTQQIEIYSTDFNIFQDSVKHIKMTTGYVNPSKNTIKLLEEINTIEETIIKIEYSNKNLDWLKNYISNNENLTAISSILLDGDVSKFTQGISRISELEKEKERTLLDVTKDHPQIIIINNEISNLKYNIVNQINLVLQKNLNDLSKIKAKKKAFLQELYNNPEKESLYSRILNENNLKESFLNNLLEVKSNYLIAKAGIVSDYIYLQKADLPKTPIAPKRFIIQTLGFLLGFLFAILFIVVRYLTHNKLVSLIEIENNCNANVLGIIPKYNVQMEHSQIVVDENPKSSIAESFRAIRTNLEFLSKKEGSKLIVTTSTISGEGKTFIGINLASIFSLLDKKVVIVDFDLRKPRIAKTFDVENQKGTSTILIGKTPYKECVRKTDNPNLDFITSGPIPPNPSELITNQVTTDFIEDLKKEYDYVIIDTPPIGLVIDSLTLLKKADYPIYVVRADYSKRQFLGNVNKLIFDNKITKLSVIFNDFGRGASGTAYKYGYSYGYGYGYGTGYGYGQGYYSDDIETEKSFLFKLKHLFKKNPS